MIGLSLCAQIKIQDLLQALHSLIKDEWFNKFSEEEQRNVIKKIVSTLDKEGVAKDIIGYPKAPPSLRLWGGATVQNKDMKALLPWIDWAYHSL